MRFHRPIVYGLLYLALIPICALVYWQIQGFEKDYSISFFDSLYFSVITITTLGYGDIAPFHVLTRFIAAFEALFGVCLIGLFLASLSHEAKFQRNQKLRQNLIDYYLRTKREIAHIIVWVSQHGGRKDIEANSETIAFIMTVDGFRSLFQDGKESNEGFYSFRNGLSVGEYQYQQLLYLLSGLGNMLDFTLQSGAIENTESLEKLRSLSDFLLTLEKRGVSYEEEKSLSGFIYNTFSGWDTIVGYFDHDPVNKIISDAR